MGTKMKQFDNEIGNFKNYLIAQGLNPIPYIKYMKAYFNFLQQNNISIKEGTEADIVGKYITYREFKPASRNLFLNCGKQYYHKYSSYPIDNSGFYKYKLIYPSKTIPNYLTEEDIYNAVKYILTYHIGYMSKKKLLAILIFLFYTGLRPGEFIKLKRSNIDLSKNPVEVMIKQSKRRKDRVTLFPHEYKNIITDYFILEAEKINAFNMNEIQFRYLIKIMGKVLNKQIHPHTLRHSAAREWVNRGIGLQIIQQLLGHANIQTTMIYTNPDEKMIKDIYKRGFKPNKEGFKCL
jgi:site-specific recombinase XerD